MTETAEAGLRPFGADTYHTRASSKVGSSPDRPQYTILWGSGSFGVPVPPLDPDPGFMSAARKHDESPETEPVSAEPEEVGKYVYCIIRSSEDREFGPIGIGEDGSLVYTLRHGDLAAVVSDTPLRIYDPTRENVLAHEMVNNTVMEDFTVIPMSFGTLFRTDEDILTLLESTSDALNDVLKKMENKIELGLKVLWDRDRVIELLAEEHEDIARLRDEAGADGRGSTYFARMQLDRLLEKAMEEKAGQYVADIYEALVPLAVASRSNKVIGENMIMNVAFLVERDREEAFDAAVKEVGGGYRDLLSFSYTGPWPPYNFVNIKLRLERAEA